MLQFDEKKLKEILMDELGYTEDRADRSIHFVRNFNEQLQPILDEWMKDRTYSDHAINGVTLEMVFEHCDVRDFISALFDMDLFASHPFMAEKFLEDPVLYNGKR
ncbi:hypothetical protein [Laceyella tengchongensis]|jgi:hypothetical protein